MSDTNKILVLFVWLIVDFILTALSFVSGGDASIVALTILGWASWSFLVYNTIIISFKYEKIRNEYELEKKEQQDKKYKETFDYDLFKSYMENRGFEVIGNGLTYIPAYHNAKRHYDIKVVINKSIKELNNEGVYHPMQKEIIGKYYCNVESNGFYERPDSKTEFIVKDLTYINNENFNDDNDYIISIKFDRVDKNDLYFNILRRNTGLTTKKLSDMTEKELYRKNNSSNRFCY